MLYRNPAFGRNTVQTVSCHRIEDRSSTSTTTVASTTRSTTINSAITTTAVTARSRTGGAQNTRGASSSRESSRKSAVNLSGGERCGRNRFKGHFYLSRRRVRSPNARRFSRIDEEHTFVDRSNGQGEQLQSGDSQSTSLQRNSDPTLNVSRNNPNQDAAQTTVISTCGDSNTSQTEMQSSPASFTGNSDNVGTSSHFYRVPFANNTDDPHLSSRSQSYNESSGDIGPLGRGISDSYERDDARQGRRRGGGGPVRRTPRVWTTLNSFDRPFRSEIWNVDLGQGGGGAEVFASQVTVASASSSQSVGDFALGSRSAIPVYSFISYPSESRYTSSISGVEPDAHAIATATARTPRHVHTAVVIAGGNENESDTALRTAINRAIAGAFAGNGEGAVAANIVNTTYRLQLWDLNDDVIADLTQCMFACHWLWS